MHLEPTTMPMTPEMTTPAPTPGEGQASDAAVADVFAALLAALAPAAPTATSAPGGTAAAAEDADETSADAGQPGTAPTAPGLSVAIDGAEPCVLTDAPLPAAHVEVLREQGGLPMVAPPETTPAVGQGDAVAGPALATNDPIAQALGQTPGAAERPAAGAAPAALGLAAATAQDAMPAEDRPGNTVDGRTLKADPTRTPVSHDPEFSIPEGRPVRTEPSPSLASTYKPVVTPENEDAVLPEAETDPATNKLPTGPADPSAGGGQPAPGVESTATVTSPEPRPPVWQPDTGATSNTPVAAPVGPEGTPTASTPTEAAHTDIAQRPVDPRHIQAQVLRQVLGRFNAADGRPQEIILQLDPEHLGKVEVRLTSQGDQLKVEFMAESAEAGAALREGGRDLVRSLTAQTGRWQHVEIKVAEPAGAAAKTDEQEEERSEQGSRRERDPNQRRRRDEER